MGHNRLGTLPDTRPWRNVVGQIADGASTAAVAGATSTAAVKGLLRGQADRGVAHVVYLLARIALAARQPGFADNLGKLGVRVPAEPSLYDLTAAFSSAMRTWYSAGATRRTDIGDMAVLAAAESLTACIGERLPGLFEAGEEVRRTVRDFSTKNGFAALGHEFFSRFTRRFLLYHLGRELSQHVGGNGRFADHSAHTGFVTDLGIHCREAALVVRQFCGGWYDKAMFEKGITERQAQGFSAKCLDKLRRELANRGSRNG